MEWKEIATPLFLYAGVINCENEFDSLNILENLDKVFGYHPKNLVRNIPNGTVLTHNTEIEDNSNAEEAFENILDDDTNAKQVDEEMEITSKIEQVLENTTDDPNSMKAKGQLISECNFGVLNFPKNN